MILSSELTDDEDASDSEDVSNTGMIDNLSGTDDESILVCDIKDASGSNED